MYVAC
jgi:hypothetical protein